MYWWYLIAGCSTVLVCISLLRVRNWPYQEIADLWWVGAAIALFWPLFWIALTVSVVKSVRTQLRA